jgi:hypothetical protein
MSHLTFLNVQSISYFHGLSTKMGTPYIDHGFWHGKQVSKEVL